MADDNGFIEAPEEMILSELNVKGKIQFKKSIFLKVKYSKSGERDSRFNIFKGKQIKYKNHAIRCSVIGKAYSEDKIVAKNEYTFEIEKPDSSTRKCLVKLITNDDVIRSINCFTNDINSKGEKLYSTRNKSADARLLTVGDLYKSIGKNLITIFVSDEMEAK